MLFPDPNVARCITDDRVRSTLLEAEKARLRREARGTKVVERSAVAGLLAGMRHLFPVLGPANRNRSPIGKDTSLGSV
jgi:hypothetical protein